MWCMQHAGPEEGLKEVWNNDKEYDDAQYCMWDPSNNIKALDTKEHHAGNEAVRS